MSNKFMFSLSMVIFGTIGLFVRFIPLPSGEIALLRAVFAFLLVGGFLLVKKQKISFKNSKKELLLLLLSGAAMGFNWIFLFEAYKYTTVSVATLSYYFAPVIVMVLSPLIFKERITLKKLICFVFSTFGLIMITGIGNLDGQNSHIKGILFGLSAALLYSAVMILNKLIKGLSGVERTFLQFLAAIIVLLPYVVFTDGIKVFALETAGIINLLIVGLIHTGLAYILYFSSLKEMEGQQVAIISYIDPLVAVLVSVFILKEDITAVQLIGGFLILFFTLANEIKFKKK
ncbi:MAG: EamA family transporter [Clostridia bacterium]|nr:EamA family transporter [Clostridia bacterium]